MNTFADWKAFLATLRAEGVPIGPEELVRLQQAFELEPRLDREGLKQLLVCTLVKDRQQRETFELLFKQWCPEEKQEEKKVRRLSEQDQQPEMPLNKKPETVQPVLKSLHTKSPYRLPRKPAHHHLPPEARWFLAVIVLVAVVFLSLLGYYWWMQRIPENPSERSSTTHTTLPYLTTDQFMSNPGITAFQ